MWQYTLKRLIQGIITVWFIATATFLAMHNVPGDPLSAERGTSEAIRANLAARYGLDKPLAEQYFIYLGNFVKGDFGISFTQQNRQVNDIIREHFPVSATLGVLAVIFAALGGVLWGALTALYRNRLPDTIIMFMVILGISVPSFVFAALGQLTLVNLNALFGISLLPVAGWGTVSHMLLPALVLGMGTMAYLTPRPRVCHPPEFSPATSCAMPSCLLSRCSALQLPRLPPVALWWSWCSRSQASDATSCRRCSSSITR